LPTHPSGANADVRALGRLSDYAEKATFECRWTEADEAPSVCADVEAFSGAEEFAFDLKTRSVPLWAKQPVGEDIPCQVT